MTYTTRLREIENRMGDLFSPLIVPPKPIKPPKPQIERDLASFSTSQNEAAPPETPKTLQNLLAADEKDEPFSPSGEIGQWLDSETPLELLRSLRNAGILITIVDVDGQRALTWELSSEWSQETTAPLVERLERDAQSIAQRLEFEMWLWRSCAEHFDGGKRLKSAPASVWFTDWRQFTRFYLGKQTEDDLHDLARFVVEAKYEASRAAANVFYGRVKIAWAIVCSLAGRDCSLGELYAWSVSVLEVAS